MLFNTKFDLVLPLGEDCACSSYLRRFVLQDYSYPFDWLAKSNFTARIELIVNNFDGFLEKSDLYEIPKPEHLQSDKYCRYFADRKFDFCYYHDFSANLPFERAYKETKEKYQRRIERMYKKINSSDKILFAYWSRDKFNRLKEEDLTKAYDKLSNKFGADKIYLLIIEYSSREENIYLKDNHILIARFDNLSQKDNSPKSNVLGNIKNNNKIFKQIYKKRQLSWIIKYVIFKINKFFIGLIPIKELRQKLRSELKFKFDRAKI